MGKERVPLPFPCVSSIPVVSLYFAVISFSHPLQFTLLWHQQFRVIWGNSHCEVISCSRESLALISVEILLEKGNFSPDNHSLIILKLPAQIIQGSDDKWKHSPSICYMNSECTPQRKKDGKWSRECREAKLCAMRIIYCLEGKTKEAKKKNNLRIVEFTFFFCSSVMSESKRGMGREELVLMKKFMEINSFRRLNSRCRVSHTLPLPPRRFGKTILS